MSIEFVGYPEISCCMEQFMNIVHLPLILNNIAIALKIVDSSRNSRRNTKKGMIKEMYIILEKGVEKQNIELGSKYMGLWGIYIFRGEDNVQIRKSKGEYDIREYSKRTPKRIR